MMRAALSMYVCPMLMIVLNHKAQVLDYTFVLLKFVVFMYNSLLVGNVRSVTIQYLFNLTLDHHVHVRRILKNEGKDTTCNYNQQVACMNQAIESNRIQEK